MFDFYKPSGCAPFSGTYSKLLVDTCIPLGDFDLHTSHRVSVYFLKHAACSETGGAWYMIGVTELLAPGLSCSDPRSFHKRPVGSGTKYLSQKEAFVVTQAC